MVNSEKKILVALAPVGILNAFTSNLFDVQCFYTFIVSAVGFLLIIRIRGGSYKSKFFNHAFSETVIGYSYVDIKNH